MLRRHGPEADPQAQTASDPTNPRAYAVTVRRDEVALSRFIKRLSASGADRIRVAYTQADVARVHMRRPAKATDWEATVARLMDRCSLRCGVSDTRS